MRAAISPQVRHRDTAPTVPCPCGSSTRIVSAADGLGCSFHVTSIADSVRHFHRNTAETYYVLEGTGRIELDGTWHEIGPGSTILIPPGTRHRLVSEAGVSTVVVAVPPFDPADEFFDESGIFDEAGKVS
jgi:mannose-6-phosphate isomerase-like protein (cupin superfamily)